MFIEVKRSPTLYVILSGPSNEVSSIDHHCGFSKSSVPCSITSLGRTMEMRLTGNKDADNSTFLKASLLEEVMNTRFGFKLLSNVTDDFLVLSREV